MLPLKDATNLNKQYDLIVVVVVGALGTQPQK